MSKSANVQQTAMTLRQIKGECLERQGHDCFERRGVIPAILESALSHTLTSETTTLLTPDSESGSSSCTLVKSAKTASVVRPADLPGPGLYADGRLELAHWLGITTKAQARQLQLQLFCSCRSPQCRTQTAV